jgi:hypothetical protein
MREVTGRPVVTTTVHRGAFRTRVPMVGQRHPCRLWFEDLAGTVVRDDGASLRQNRRRLGHRGPVRNRQPATLSGRRASEERGGKPPLRKREQSPRTPQRPAAHVRRILEGRAHRHNLYPGKLRSAGREVRPHRVVRWCVLPYVLKAKGYSVQYSEFCGGHDYVSWRGSFADGLMALAGVSGKE